ncbi:hypothetical protein GQ53DRAFT_749388 [Thozetella sp. PMI_491]|nr:hypothetical protein GQ53DRAFT_749388 [Thozetella sp. PMI_491]
MPADAGGVPPALPVPAATLPVAKDAAAVVRTLLEEETPFALTLDPRRVEVVFAAAAAVAFTAAFGLLTWAEAATVRLAFADARFSVAAVDPIWATTDAAVAFGARGAKMAAVALLTALFAANPSPPKERRRRA